VLTPEPQTRDAAALQRRHAGVHVPLRLTREVVRKLLAQLAVLAPAQEPAPQRRTHAVDPRHLSRLPRNAGSGSPHPPTAPTPPPAHPAASGATPSARSTAPAGCSPSPATSTGSTPSAASAGGQGP